MKTQVYIGLMLLFTGSARAYVSVDVDASVNVENRITGLDIAQEIGSERIECGGGAGAAGLVSVVRIVKTKASASAQAEARANARASARYSDSCHCSGSGSCSTSGSGSDSDSASASDKASADKMEEVKFTVARTSAGKLLEKGFTLRQGSSCEITDSAGLALNPIGAIAVVTWIYGEETIQNNPLAMQAVREFYMKKMQASPDFIGVPVPDEGFTNSISFDRLNGGAVK